MDDIQLVLGSKSPRRKELVKHLGFPVEVRVDEVEEIYPVDIDNESVPEYLAKLKAMNLVKTLDTNEILITSDTVVIFGEEILGKPTDRQDAINMLRKLSGHQHDVISGVYLYGMGKESLFSVKTEVIFDELSLADIEEYVDTWKPFDKAGSYGIQDWIGYIGIKGIKGCYYNVMGLPVNEIYNQLNRHFLS